LVDLALGPAALAFLGASTPQDQTAIDRILEAHGESAFPRAWLEARGLSRAAEAIARYEMASAPGEPAGRRAHHFAEVQNGRSA
jgi:hypothetical protein